MSDIGDDFAALKEAGKKKKADNQESSTRILIDKSIPFTSHNWGNHLVVYGNEIIFDFWPSTGKFISRNKKTKGRGVFSMIKKLNLNRES